VFAAGALEEVIVTARKREEDLQALPQAITAIQADQLESAQVNNIQNLQNLIPNVTIGNSGAVGATRNLNAIIRGVGNEVGFAPGVGIYVDDVYLTQGAGAILDVYDVERVEVLKGPQGNLYGRNTIGGAIRYITKEPSEQFTASIQGKIGTYDRREVTATTSGPLVDNLLYGGIALSRKTQGGTQTNTFDGREFGKLNSWGARGSLKLTPTDKLTAKWVTDYYYNNALDPIGKGIYPFSPLISAGDSNKDHISTAFTRHPNPQSYVRSLGHALTLNWEVSDSWAMKSVTAYRFLSNKPIQDIDGSEVQAIEITQTLNDTARSQEFQMNYTGDGVDGVVGLYYLKEQEDRPIITDFYQVLVVIPNFTRDQFTRTDSISKSLYTSWDFDLSDDWHLTLGGRQNLDHQEADFTQTEYYTACPPTFASGPCTIPYGTTSFSKSWRKFTKTMRLAYDVSPDTMTYIGYSEGYKQGGFNTTGGQLAIQFGKSAFNPENVKTYTAGFKTTLLENTLRVNAEWFYNDYRDKLLSTVQTRPITFEQFQVNENAGAVHTTGVDLDISWSTPIEGLTINGAVGYLEAVFDKYQASVFNADGSALLNPDVASSRRLGFSPRWTASIAPTYTLNLESSGKLQFVGNASYRDKSYALTPADTQAPNAQVVVSPAYTMYDASIAWLDSTDAWRIALEGKNLSDQRPLVNAFNGIGTLGMYADPRTWALSVRYQIK